MDEELKKEKHDAEFEKKREEAKKTDEEKTDRNRRKREKANLRKANNGKGAKEDEEDMNSVRDDAKGRSGAVADPARVENTRTAENGNATRDESVMPKPEEVGVVIHDDD